MPYFFSPVGNAQFVDSNGKPLVGGKINTYLAGTSTPATTYTSNTGIQAQANPVVLNALGMPDSPIWLDGSLTYKFVITTSADVVLFTVDNVVGVNDPQEDFSQWVTSGMTPTYISTTSFSVTGNQTAVLQANRRIEYTLNSGTYYGYIVSAIFGSVTTVTVAPDATNLDATLSSFRYGFISATNTSIPQQFILDAADKVPARSAPTNLTLLSNNGTTQAWYSLVLVQQIKTATGTYTPTAGMVYCKARIKGGGSGGAQLAAGNYGGAGGSSGEYAEKFFSAADIGASQAVTIGDGGAANTGGGTTSLGALLTAIGATASTTKTPSAGGTGGTGGGLRIQGAYGDVGAFLVTAELRGGKGGESEFGAGGFGGSGGGLNASNGTGYGSGGGGNGFAGTWSTAGSGKAGVVVIDEYVLDLV